MDAALNITGTAYGLRPLPAGNAVSQGKPPADPQQLLNNRRLREQCSEFESLLYATMLHAMRKTVDKAELFYGGQAEEIFTSMLDDEYSKIMSNNAQQGIAEALYQQLMRQQLSHNIQQKNTASTANVKQGM